MNAMNHTCAANSAVIGRGKGIAVDGYTVCQCATAPVHQECVLVSASRVSMVNVSHAIFTWLLLDSTEPWERSQMEGRARMWNVDRWSGVQSAGVLYVGVKDMPRYLFVC